MRFFFVVSDILYPADTAKRAPTSILGGAQSVHGRQIIAAQTPQFVVVQVLHAAGELQQTAIAVHGTLSSLGWRRQQRRHGR